jgi:hypothetical protein
MMGYIGFRLESGKEMTKLDGTHFVGYVTLQFKNGRDSTVEANDELIKFMFEEYVFQPFVKSMGYRVSSVLTQMEAKIEYELRIPFAREMSEEEEREYIDVYLQKDDVIKLVYQPTNITSFQFEDDGLDEEWREIE